MKKYWCFIFVVFFMGCTSKPDSNSLKYLQGYWEIDEVEFPDGNKKVYQVNELIDLFEIQNKKGFRTKVKPQLDGTFLKSTMKDPIVVLDSNDVVYLKTMSKYSTMIEKIIEVNEKELVIKNESNIVYHYKKFVPYSKR